MASGIGDFEKIGQKKVLEMYGETLKTLDGIKKIGELKFYKMALMGLKSEWGPTKQGSKNKKDLRRAVLDRITTIRDLKEYLNKDEPYHEFRERNLDAAEEIMLDLLSGFGSYKGRRSVPKHEERVAAHALSMNLVADLYGCLDWKMRVETKELALEDLRKRHETDMYMISTYSKYKITEKYHSDNGDAWYALPQVSTNFAENRAPLIELAILRKDPSVLYAGHPISDGGHERDMEVLNNAKEKLAQKVDKTLHRYKYQGKNGNGHWPALSNMLIVEEINRLLPKQSIAKDETRKSGFDRLFYVR